MDILAVMITLNIMFIATIFVLPEIRKVYNCLKGQYSKIVLVSIILILGYILIFACGISTFS